MVVISNTDARLMAMFLSRICEHLASEGSTDSDLKTFIPDDEEREEFIKRYMKWDEKANPEGWDAEWSRKSVDDDYSIACFLYSLVDKGEGITFPYRYG